MRATIVLDRASGAILKTSGQVSSIRTTQTPVSPAPAAGSFSEEGNGEDPSRDQGAEELAAMIWNFVSTAGSFVQNLDTEVWLESGYPIPDPMSSIVELVTSSSLVYVLKRLAG